MTLNLADPELELIDPTPNVHTLFIHFDKMFFWTKLASRAVVRWSKRMYSCAGVCSYEGRGGLCDIALSEPLLKLRPRKDLIETLLHEMIHAFLFVTGNDRDRDGHGPNFQSHMHRLNNAAGLKISIYHDFHDEVKLYQTHWWRCNGPCQLSKPYFGMVRRSSNRAPGPTDFWWTSHSRKCGGTFIKIKEPEKQAKKNAQPKPKPKPMGDITKFVTNGNPKSPIVSTGIKSNGGGTVVVTKKNVVFNPKPEQKPIVPFDGKGHTIGDKTIANDSVAETVRNVWLSKNIVKPINNIDVDDISRKVREAWANIQLDINKNSIAKNNMNNTPKRAATKVDLPPAKIKKIDDYFRTTASSLLKDVYGEDFKIHETSDNRLVAIQNSDSDHVDCPICKSKIRNAEINSHIDECLNKEEIDRLTNEPSTSGTNLSKHDRHDDKVAIKTEPDEKVTVKPDTDEIVTIKIEDAVIKTEQQNCPCCGEIITKTTEDHLEECLAFFDNNMTQPEEGSGVVTIVIDDDDDDVMDESMTMNATGTKTPCPVCLKMVEQDNMNDHLDLCLAS